MSLPFFNIAPELSNVSMFDSANPRCSPGANGGIGDEAPAAGVDDVAAAGRFDVPLVAGAGAGTDCELELRELDAAPDLRFLLLEVPDDVDGWGCDDGADDGFAASSFGAAFNVAAPSL